MTLPKPSGLDERLQAPPATPPRLEELGDQCVTLHGISWELYRAIDAARGESAVPRLHYHDGVLEIMNPGLAHETAKTRMGRLVEAYCDENGIILEGVGSWTLRKEAVKRGAEADESYIIGAERVESAEVPDFAIEIVETGESTSKLNTYKALGVPEVWFYRHQHLEVFVLAEGFYLKSERSLSLPGLDLLLLERCMLAASSFEAVKMLRAALRGTP